MLWNISCQSNKYFLILEAFSAGYQKRQRKSNLSGEFHALFSVQLWHAPHFIFAALCQGLLPISGFWIPQCCWAADCCASLWNPLVQFTPICSCISSLSLSSCLPSHLLMWPVCVQTDVTLAELNISSLFLNWTEYQLCLFLKSSFLLQISMGRKNC